MKHTHFRLTRAVKTALALAALSAFSGLAWAEMINLNTADSEAIQYIPGIGKSRAEQIVQAREKAGGFSSMDDIDAIPGIGEAIMRDIKKYGSLESGVSELTEEMRNKPPLRSSQFRQNATANTGGS